MLLGAPRASAFLLALAVAVATAPARAASLEGASAPGPHEVGHTRLEGGVLDYTIPVGPPITSVPGDCFPKGSTVDVHGLTTTCHGTDPNAEHGDTTTTRQLGTPIAGCDSPLGFDDADTPTKVCMGLPLSARSVPGSEGHQGVPASLGTRKTRAESFSLGWERANASYPPLR